MSATNDAPSTTPAVERGSRAIVKYIATQARARMDGTDPDAVVDTPPLARAVLEAALVGAELGQVVRAHRPYYLRSGRARCGGCDWTFEPEWEGTESSERRTSARRAFSNHQGDAIRAMVLGEAP